MNFLRTLTTTSAALALAVGVATPCAFAQEATPGVADVKPEQLWGLNVGTLPDRAQTSTIEEVNVAEAMKPYLKEVTGADGKTKEIADPPKDKRWLTAVYNYRDAATGMGGKVKYYTATSPAMGGRKIPLNVITPTGNFDAKRPTIYLLNGAGGADQGMDWIQQTYNAANPDEDLIKFYLKKNVNVVIIQAGAFSYYTDWLESPNAGYLKGPQKWETFLTKELPGPLEDKINSDGQRAIAGMSMSATSSLLLAEHNPDFYDAVGSYSGCASTNSLMPRFYTFLTVNRGGGTPTQMWGPMNGNYAKYNDALINANNLKDTEIYVSTNSGIVGKEEQLSSLMDARGGSSLENFFGAYQSSSTLAIEGGAIEAAMNDCTRQFERRLDSLGIKAEFNYRPTGVHSWPGWRKDIHESWPVYARAFGQNPDPKAVDPAVSGSTVASAPVDDVIPAVVPNEQTDRAAVELNDAPLLAPSDVAAQVESEAGAQAGTVSDAREADAAASPATTDTPAAN